MAPRTLASSWKQYERIFSRGNGAGVLSPETVKALDVLGEKTNGSRITEALASLFVQPYQGMDEANVEFLTTDGGPYPDWPAQFDEERKVIVVNPVGVLRFCRECEEAVEALSTAEARESFPSYRYRAYLAELRKLPTQLLLFLQVLREVARSRKITRIEKKGGEIETADDERYLHLLWAFKELEGFFSESNGVNLRSEHGILWYESDWVIGKR